MLAFLKELRRSSQPFLSNIKIVLTIDDISSRCFPFWASKVLEAPKRNEDSESDYSYLLESDQLPNTVKSISVKLMSIGTKLSSISKVKSLIMFQ